jgi:hypothetical protein
VRGIASQRATIDENIILPTSKGAAGCWDILSHRR